MTASPSSAAPIRRRRASARWTRRKARFDRVSFDLIYALPGDDEASWSRDLDRALSLGTEHLSLYQLTIEPGTRFATMVAKREFEPLDADAAAGLFELTQERTAAAGLPAYEISNHARPGAESRHNLATGATAIMPASARARTAAARACAPCATRSPRTSSPRSRATATGWSRRSGSRPKKRRMKRWSWACASPRGSTRPRSPSASASSASSTSAAVDRLIGHGLLEREGRSSAPPPPGRLLLELDPRRNRRLESASPRATRRWSPPR